MDRAKQPAHRIGARGNRQHKETFYVRVAAPDGRSEFYPATDYLGGMMPFKKPKETFAKRVYPDVVAFVLTHLTKKRATDVANAPLLMPHNQLGRLAGIAPSLELPDGELVVEREGEARRYIMERDEAGIVTLTAAGVADMVAETAIVEDESSDNAEPATAEEPRGGKRITMLPAVDVTEEPAIELDRRGERISLFFTSPSVKRTVALSFNGHLGKPGDSDTLARCAAKILNAAIALDDFRLLSNIEAIAIPPMTGRGRPAALRTPPASVEVAVQLFDADLAPVGAGTMRVEIDLEHAHANIERLNFRLQPSDSISEQFPAYKELAERYVRGKLPELLGDELQGIIYDIVLGEVETSTVERLNEMLSKLPGVDVAPDKIRQHG